MTNCVGAGSPTVSVSFVRKGAEPSPGGLASGLAAWTNDPNSFVTLTDGGAYTGPTTAPDANDNINVIYYGYTGAFTGVCDGGLACTLGSGGFTHTYDGDTWVAISDADIIIAPSVSGGQYPSLMTHELGHAIGIRHSDQGTPSCTSAIMNSNVPVSFGTTLQQWDKDAVDSLYGSGPVCVTPVISGTTGGGTVNAGSTTTLTVSVNLLIDSVSGRGARGAENA